MYAYDCLLTFPLEVSEIWSARISLAKAAYLMSRYGELLLWVLNVTYSIKNNYGISVSRPFNSLFVA